MGERGEEPDQGATPTDHEASEPDSRSAFAPPGSAGDESRAVAAWRSWLTALASDAEAALAAAMTYASLPEDVRDGWLDALDRDVGSIDVPRVAIYAPLLAVETDDARRARIAYAMGVLRPGARDGNAQRGETASGDVVCAIATPLYLDFVELLVCRYRPDGGVVSAHHEPFRHASQVATAVESALEEPVALTPAPMRVVIEELAHAVVADGREGRSPPDALARFSHLFTPDLEGDVPAA